VPPERRSRPAGTAPATAWCRCRRAAPRPAGAATSRPDRHTAGLAGRGAGNGTRTPPC